MISPPREVVITGIGAASPIGIGYEAVKQSLLAGVSGVRSLALFDSPEFRVRIAAEVVDFDPKQYVTPRKSLKVMSRSIQLAFAASQLAIADAELAAGQVEPDAMGVVFGADMIQVEPDELINAFRACINGQDFEFARWDERAIGEMFPLWMLKYLPNMPACHVAIAHDARGPNNTIVLAEASSLLAIAEGMHVIERGHADVMIVGGTGSRIHPLSWVFRDPLLKSPRWSPPTEVSCPFDAHRDGMVFGEGSAAFILESRQHAEARGARIRAQIVGFGNSFEACTPGRGVPGQAIRASIAQALRQAKIQPGEVGHVNAHGLSTVEHDRVEAESIRELLGDVPVTAPKSFFGNLGAGTGAVELVSTLVAFDTGRVPHTLNYRHPDPRCPIDVVRDAPREARQRTALVLNHTTMGQAVALALRGEG